MSAPDTLRVHRAGLTLILRAPNQGASIGEDGESPTLDVRDEDVAGPTGGAERFQSTAQSVEVDRTIMDRIEGNRVAPTQRGQDLGPSDPQVFSFSMNAGGAIGATGQMDLLDFRVPSVDDEQVSRGGFPDHKPEGFARLDRSYLGGHRVEDAGGLAGRQAAGGGCRRGETTKACRGGGGGR